ncbi:MAG: HAD-IA family hydrolase [Gammaproteobacteria bacterium]
MQLKAVLLDLDGTLVDTAPDLVAVLNAVLKENGQTAVPYAIARNAVSDGVLGLLRLGFGPDLQKTDLESLRRRFIDIYIAHTPIKSILFNGIINILNNLEESKIRWGIVTNKPAKMTLPLLKALGICDRATSIISGDRLPQCKPHPAPLLLAAEEVGVLPFQCVYVGDARRDVTAGQAAGMRTIVAAYGYIPPSEDPNSWGADCVIRRPAELPSVLAKLTFAAQ